MNLHIKIAMVLLILCAFVSEARCELTDSDREARSLSYNASQYLKQKDYASAEPLLRRAVALDARNKGAQYNLAWTLNAQGKFRDAIDPAKRAADLDNTDHDAKILLGNCYTKVQDYRSAAYVLEKALSEPMSPADKNSVLESLSYAYVMLKDYRHAAEQQKQMIAINPNIATNWYWCGMYQQMSGQFTEAQKSYTTFLSRFPADKQAVTVKNALEKLKREAQTVQFWGRWATMPITVCLLDPDKPVRGYHENYRALVGRALKTWQDSSSGLISFQFVDKPDKARIVIYWTDDVNALKDHESKAIGLTNFEKMESASRIGKVKMSLLTINPEDKEPFKDLALESIALHEVGHSLGLPHSSNPADVMFPWERNEGNSRTVLSARDLNWLRQLYTYKSPAERAAVKIKGTNKLKPQQ